MNASNFLESHILNSIFGNTDFSATLKVGLYNDATDDANGGTEVVGGSYARAVITNDRTNFPLTATDKISNAVAVNFAQATASWGTATHYRIFDENDNPIVHGELTTPKTIATNDSPTIAIGQLEIQAS